MLHAEKCTLTGTPLLMQCVYLLSGLHRLMAGEPIASSPREVSLMSRAIFFGKHILQIGRACITSSVITRPRDRLWIITTGEYICWIPNFGGLFRKWTIERGSTARSHSNNTPVYISLARNDFAFSSDLLIEIQNIRGCLFCQHAIRHLRPFESWIKL